MRTATPEDLAKAATRLRKALNMKDGEDTAELTEYASNAWQAIAAYLGPESVPDSLMRQAVHIVALEFQRREKAPGGVLAAFGGEGGPVRLARDPLTPAYPLLKPFIKAGIG